MKVVPRCLVIGSEFIQGMENNDLVYESQIEEVRAVGSGFVYLHFKGTLTRDQFSF